jgi:diketogulonate reductase-like aldo/keto reductase
MDSAHIYRGGEHERDIGAVLGSGRWDRSEIFVTTKTSSHGPNVYSECPAVTPCSLPGLVCSAH